MDPSAGKAESIPRGGNKKKVKPDKARPSSTGPRKIRLEKLREGLPGRSGAAEAEGDAEFVIQRPSFSASAAEPIFGQ
jgi:hypothetical protein